MRIETPHKLWSMAGDLNYAIVGSLIKEVWMPQWNSNKYKREKKKKPDLIDPSQLIGWYFSSVETHGKSLLLKLENYGAGTRYIGCNLGQGLWMVKDKFAYTAPWSDSIYVIFLMSHPMGYDYQLLFYDKKRHGKLEIKEHVHQLILLNRYGPPIDSPDFTLEYVEEICENSNATWRGYEQPWHLKSLLLKQKFFAGVTNKMASEICFLGNLYPDCYAKDLNKEQISRLYHAILLVFSTFSRQRGYHEFMIYGRYNCPVCNAKVKTYKTYNQITYYCPVCQDPNFQTPKPISQEYVEEILRISKDMPYVKTGFEQRTERLAQQRLLSANVGKGKE